MHVLITGASGLVASRIAQHLSFTRLNIRLASRSELPYSLNNISVSQVDWSSQHSVDSICENIDVVIHASGMNSHDSALDPLAAFSVNGIGSARLRLSASRAGVRRIIYFSTAHVYKSPLVGTFTEDFPTSNLHPYASSHLSGETALYTPPNLTGPEIVVLRMSNAFGAPLHPSANCWSLLANDLCRQAVSMRYLRLNTSGQQQRNFIPLSFVCTVIEQLLYLQPLQSAYEIFNLGGLSMSVREFATLIQSQASMLLGQELPLDIPVSKSDLCPKNLDFRSTKLSRYLDLPPLCLEAEIDRLLAFCLNHFT